MPVFANSLAARLLQLIAFWLVASLLVTGLFLSSQFENNAEANFGDLLQAHVFNIMGSIEVDETGDLTSAPNLGDPRFLTPLSGWYWAVSKAETAAQPLLYSKSITGEPINLMPATELPFDGQFRRSYEMDEGDKKIRRLEAQLFLGESDVLYQVTVAGNAQDVDDAISQFNRQLLIFFSLFALGTIAVVFVAIRFALRPLDDAKRALAQIRSGHAEMLDGSYPREIEPLASEINALISANKSVLERARTQVGNLAHALKTPLAVILNEVRSSSKAMGPVIEDQVQLMNGQITSYLDRARIGAQRDVISRRTELAPVTSRILGVMRKLSPQLTFEAESVTAQAVFHGEQQDLEEILGNLLENASRFARSTIRLSISSKGKKIAIEIADDGPGLEEYQFERAIKRGARLDETTPGSGLGLSIVQDIASEYGGEIELKKSDLGGLSVVVVLPGLVLT